MKLMNEIQSDASLIYEDLCGITFQVSFVYLSCLPIFSLNLQFHSLIYVISLSSIVLRRKTFFVEQSCKSKSKLQIQTKSKLMLSYTVYKTQLFIDIGHQPI